MLPRTVKDIFDQLISALVELYEDGSDSIDLLYDIRFQRCRRADKDHWRDRRVYMHIGCDERTICVSSSIELLDKQNLQGLYAHEIGHIIHLQMPQLLEDSLDEQELEMIQQLDDPELAADWLIDRLFGLHIYYDQNKVQWLST